ncbi:MAG TPA: PspC domain-containing protein [Anaerolineae bacterium]|jgi:phage shock protein C|nr:PspC domain-containing protein [Anaerolineae bacterium]
MQGMGPSDEGRQENIEESKEESRHGEEAKSVEAGPEEPEEVQARAVPREHREEPRRLYRSRENRVIAGVAGGIGEYFGVDPTIIRLAWVFLTLLGGAGIIAYIVAWIIIPEWPAGKKEPEVPREVSGDVGLIIGLVLLGLGVWLLLNRLDLIPEPFFVFLRILENAFWPTLLIIIGVFVIIAATRGRGLTTDTEGKRLYRSRRNRVFTGVAGGIAEYFGIDPTLVRIIWVALFFVNFAVALIAYIVAAIVIPEQPEEKVG